MYSTHLSQKISEEESNSGSGSLSCDRIRVKGVIVRSPAGYSTSSHHRFIAKKRGNRRRVLGPKSRNNGWVAGSFFNERWALGDSKCLGSEAGCSDEDSDELHIGYFCSLFCGE